MIKNIAMATLILGAAMVGPTATEAKAKTTIEASNGAKFCTVLKTVNGKVWKDVYYMYSGANYHMFLDTSAEPGSNVFAVHRNSINRWGINMMKVDMGQQMTGVFDKTGRDLLKIKL